MGKYHRITPVNTKRSTFFRTNLPALSCAALAVLVRLIGWLSFHTSILFAPAETGGHDRSVYLQAIKQIANGSFWPQGSFDYLPLYPWLIGLLTSWFGHPLMTAAFFGVAADTATTFLIVTFALRLGAPRCTATTAGCLYAAYPLAAIYSLLTMPNSVNAFGVTLFAWIVYRIGQSVTRPRLLVFASAGLFAGIMALGFAGLLPIAAAVAVFFALRFRSLMIPAIFLAAFALPIAPVALHNTRAEGQFVLLTTHGGFNLYMGNHPEATGYPLRVKNFRMTARLMLEDAHAFAEQQTGETLSKAASSGWWSEQAKTFWRERPLTTVLLTAKKLMLFWNFRDVDDLRLLEQLRITDPSPHRWTGTPFVLFGLLGLIGLIYARGATAPRLVLVVGMIGLVMFFITARYRLTFIPLMALLGAAGMPGLWHGLRSHPFPHATLFVTFAAVVFFPFYLRDQRPVDHYNAAIQLMQAGRDTKAMMVVDAGLAIAPEYAELYFARGNLFFKQGRYSDAATSYTQSLSRNPNQPTAVFNLALSLARNGDFCGARNALLEMQRAGMPIDERSQALFKDVQAGCESTGTTPSP
jgi:tetratricopeptide (TPR) repeat protein